MANDVESRFHEAWLGMVQPVDGLVVSVPVLADAQCMERQPPAVQEKVLELCPPVAAREDERAIADLPRFLHEVLGLGPDLFDAGDALPRELSLFVPEGRQTLRPTLALRHQASAASETAHVALVWELPLGLDLDRPETVTGTWEYPPSAKLDRLLRHCKVPIGLLTNRTQVRLIYAPHGESSGSMTFRVGDMASVGGRPILDAFVMLLSAKRFFGVLPEHQLSALLVDSRKRQLNVTNELAAQVFEALEILLRGFEAAAERDGRALLDDAVRREDDHLYGGLLTVLLRLVFLLYAEDRGLMPVEKPFYSQHLSVLALFDQLQQDHGAFPDSMSRRFGAWPRLLAAFRAVFLGVQHGDFRMPARRGHLFDPQTYPFLEGWGPAGGAPLVLDEQRAAVRVPSVDDQTLFRVLERLILLGGQRLSYRTLDVEQIGSVYEALMGYHVVQLDAPAVCLKPSRVWVTAEEVEEVPSGQRAKWLQETAGLAKSQAEKLAAALKEAGDGEAVLAVLEGSRVRGTERAATGRLVIQPGAERRRTSSHYTPRSLTEPIVKRTIEPLIAAMGGEPPADALLDLKICDPAMGSGAFLVAACRFLGDEVIKAWTREGNLHDVAASGEDPVMVARRLVAQRCLYGVDRNAFAVNLAKLSLWLATLARELPFTFLDHALRHGDSLVGLDFEQIASFHWKQSAQLETCRKTIEEALDEAVGSRQRILELARDPSPEAQREKEVLLADAQDALQRVRLIGDLLVGAFFSAEKDKDREKERVCRLGLVTRWLGGEDEVLPELQGLAAEMRARLPVFHWMAEFPEIFWAGRRDPLTRVTRRAWIDAIVGNPPFTAGGAVSSIHGVGYRDWLPIVHPSSHGAADLSAHFFRRADVLLGDNGTLGFLATSTISQGDTRATGLRYLLSGGSVIYDATTRLPWRGGPNVAISVMHLAKGDLPVSERRLDGVAVAEINSQLAGCSERGTARSLVANEGCCSMGTKVSGQGFLLPLGEGEKLAGQLGSAIKPYLGGDEVTTSPTQAYERFIIDVTGWTEARLQQQPQLLALLNGRVRSEREGNSRIAGPWWNFERPRPELYRELSRLSRCLVVSTHTKYLVFAWKPTTLVFSHSLYVFPVSSDSFFSTVQSRLFESWAWLHSSTLEDRAATARIRFHAQSFETFPFPQPDPRAAIPALESIGRRLYDTRAQYMVETQQGLTQTYNRLKDPGCTEPRIVELRELHLEMDRAVLAAYGWSGIPVPAYTTPTTETEKKALETFEDEVIDRLFVLNAQRAEAERAAALPPPLPKRAAKRKARSTTNQQVDITLHLDTPSEGPASRQAPTRRVRGSDDS